MAADATVCPDCAGPVRADRDRLCPRCGYPLMFLETESTPDAAPVGRKPGERDDATAVLAAVERHPPGPAASGVPDEPPAAGENRCGNCGQHNPGSRIRCERCGHEVRRPDPVPVPVLSPAPDRRRAAAPSWAVPAATAAVVLAVVALLVWQFAGATEQPTTPRSTATRGTALVPVERAVITPEASSTIPDDPRLAVTKTLDGDPYTAWNSDGRQTRDNTGVRLTYTFSRDVQLARITVTNGFDRSRSDDPHNNQWLKECTVSAGGHDWDWQMKETIDPQSKDADFGRIRKVTLTVKAVYPGTGKFRDLAVAEVGFAERR